MDRQAYNNCVKQGLSGKKFTPEQRKLEFCVTTKLCAGKSKSRDEAMAICKQPKAPKQAKAGKGKKLRGKSCENDMMALTQCMTKNIDMSRTSDINSIGAAMLISAVQCRCS